MGKIAAIVAAILIAVATISVYFISTPAMQQQIDDNTAAIQTNTEYIRDVEDFAYTVDGITDGLNTRLETLEDIKIYQHKIQITTTDLFCGIYIYNNKSNQLTYDNILNTANSFTIYAHGHFTYQGSVYSIYVLGRYTFGTTLYAQGNTFSSGDQTFTIPATATVSDTITQIL